LLNAAAEDVKPVSPACRFDERSGRMTNLQLWWLSLGLAAVVVVVVAVLLGLIIATAKSIDYHASAIWIAGKQIAGNTVSIWMLAKTNDQVARMLDAAQSIDRTAASMDAKLRALADADGKRA
jgi:hypothetical protein